jgi:sugar/nucleoside kinase (ribokinase family)
MHRVRAAPDVVVAGHICLDVIPELTAPPDLHPGGLVVIGPSAVNAGGPVGNVGLALDRLGVLRGRDAGLADGMIVARGETTSYSVVISPPGVDRTFLHCPGANDTFEAADVALDGLRGARIFHFGYPPIMRRLYGDGGNQMRTLLAAVRDRGLVTSLDLCEPDPRSCAARVDWGAWLARVLPVVDLFAPSLDELRVMLAPAADGTIDLARLRALAGRALRMGAAMVALKLGDQGLYVRTGRDVAALERLCAPLALDPADWRDREVLSPCFRPGHVAGTTGSGDCTIAGLLAALLRRENPVTVATSATAVGACSVEAADATSGVPPWTEVAARLAAGWSRLPILPSLAAASWRCDAHGTLFDPL